MKRLSLFILLTLLLGYVPPGHTAETLSEYKVKAAYLYNFAKFIEWPEAVFATDQSPLIIGVLGANPFREELIPLTAKKIRNRSIEVRYYTKLSEANDCHLLFVSSTGSGALGEILKAFVGQSVVTVSDAPDFAARGGMIQFVTRRDRLRFSINLKSAKQGDIQINSQLLSLAAEILGRTD